MKRKDILILVALGLVAVIFRMYSSIPNVSPIGALAIFSGLLIGRKPLAYIFPISIMLLSDLLLGILDSSYIHPLIPVVYLSYFLMVYLGSRINNSKKITQTLSYTLLSSISFFILTNLGVWLQGDLYPKNLAGLSACYINAIPFFRNTLIGDIAFSMAFYLVINSIVVYKTSFTKR